MAVSVTLATHDTESKILATALAYQDAAAVILDGAVLHATDFDDVTHAQVYTILRSCQGREQHGLAAALDEAQARGWTDARALILSDLTGVLHFAPESADVAVWIKAIQARRELRRKADLQQRIVQAVMDDNMERARALLEKAAESETTYSTAPTAPMDVNDLMALERKPPLWYAPSFLREGFGLLVGQPNVGKTPLVLQLALALATGSHWMGTVLCRRARVLFLGTEYTRQELIPILDDSSFGTLPNRGSLTFKTIDDDDICPPTATDAISALEYYIAIMGYEVIIIDVLTGFLPTEGFKQNVYRGDYGEFRPYHRLAQKYNASILGTWHASKREADPRLMYNGSTGMWAVPASRMSMYEDVEGRVRVFSMPRFCEKKDWALAQEKTDQGRRWVVSDAAPEPMCSPTELQIYRCLKDHANSDKPIGPTTVAELTNIPIGTVKSGLSRMFKVNMVQQPRGTSGYYVEGAATNATNIAAATAATAATPSVYEGVASATTLQPEVMPVQGIDTPSAKRLQELQGFTLHEELQGQNGTNRQRDTDRAYDDRQVELAERCMGNKQWGKASHIIGGMRSSDRRKEMGRILLAAQQGATP